MIKFEEVTIKRTRKGVCSCCGKQRIRRLSWTQTLNPFRGDGATTIEQVRQSVCAEADAAMERPFVCVSCARRP